MTTTTQYARLSAHFATISHFEHFNTLGDWDMATMMPPAGSQQRAEAMASLSGHIHQLRTAPWLNEAINAATDEPLTDNQRANLTEMTRTVQQATLIPAELVETKTRAALACEHAWRTQRQNNDWAGFRPNLEKVIALVRQEAEIRSQALGIAPYDTLLDKFEPGMTSAKLDALFSPLRQQLPGLIQQVQQKQVNEQPVHLNGHYPAQAQQQLSRQVMTLLGFDFNQGRLDSSSHPFSCGAAGDTRITTRYDESDFSAALMSTIHETGHARYEQGLPLTWQGQPAGMARSMAVHESQSLFFEMQLGRSHGFLQQLHPLINQHLGTHFTLEQLQHGFSRVTPGLIRVDADEVTYPCHILLRYQAEQALVTGNLTVAELPEFWHANMSQMLGVSTLGNDKDGCMQDIHWTVGELGYFPSYTLGAMIAAQLRDALEQQLGNMDTLLAQGQINDIFAFLQRRIWQHASLMSTEALILSATGKALSADSLLAHLARRYA
ncbi:carboxypeptidase M32 [Shewanella sp. NFH-SH190041]|nr:carboxypeptidase M32 [Shewanella sp. NFH-SH190041]BDM63455.1 carboxypeptidase M32 [Shewanella sp. NFH-SH190041]